jgi:hypothetical protein
MLVAQGYAPKGPCTNRALLAVRSPTYIFHVSFILEVEALRRTGRASADNATGCGVFVGQPVTLR